MNANNTYWNGLKENGIIGRPIAAKMNPETQLMNMIQRRQNTTWRRRAGDESTYKRMTRKWALIERCLHIPFLRL